MAERQCYAVDKFVIDRVEAELVCGAVIDVLRPILRMVQIDAISDFRSEMPAHVQQAEATLRRLGLGQRPPRGDPNMAIDVSTGDVEWPAAELYAPWSINVDLLGERESVLGTLHDCGLAVTAELTVNEAAALRRRLEAVAPVTLLAELHARRRAAKRQRRRRLLDLLLGRHGRS